ncbi:uncharacterized protein [Typha angustifolia]|uniref:uncharacterized protein n=1 Tax=Typha angustifolia TaxID=59011 RepID=UPI003C2B1753
MGISASIMKKMGMQNLNYTDKIYDKYFKEDSITTLEEFHVAFIDLCSDFNSIMPGKHYELPPRKDIKKFFDDTWETNKNNPEEQKKKLIDFMCENVKESKSGSAMILTGLAAPPAAIFLKKAVDNMPQAKKFRLHLVPNFAFVPSFTILSLVGVRLVQTYQKSKTALQ